MHCDRTTAEMARDFTNPMIVVGSNCDTMLAMWQGRGRISIPYYCSTMAPPNEIRVMSMSDALRIMGDEEAHV